MKTKPKKAKRLSPTKDTLRALFLRSGNLCAFPNCPNLMMNVQGKFIGQICHIEAAEEGGERFNSKMTNEERRDIGNLILLCYEHHVMTNDTTEYTVKSLKGMKSKHESKFSDASSAMLERLRDHTQAKNLARPKNLSRLNSVLAWKLKKEEIQGSVEELDEFIDKVRNAPDEARQLLGVLGQRFNTLQAHQKPNPLGMELDAEDVVMALRLGRNKLKTMVDVLQIHGLAWFDKDHDGKTVIVLSGPGGMYSWTYFWADLAKFCEKTNTDIQEFTLNLRFDLLD